MIGRSRATESPVRVCITNLVCGAGVVVTGSSETTDSPATNILKPGRPMLPWRTAAGGAQNVVVDLLTATTLTGIWLIRTNFSQVTIQGNATNVWTSPTFSRAFTISRNPWNFRYQLAVPLTGFTFRYLRILIPSQTPVDGTAAYLLGGVYAGVTERIPQNFRFDVELTTVQPALDEVQQSGAWRQRLVMGEPLAAIAATRAARLTVLAPGYADDLNRWQDLARRIRDNDIFALVLGAQDPSQGFVVRPVNQNHWKWTRRNLLRTESIWELEEVMGP